MPKIIIILIRTLFRFFNLEGTTITCHPYFHVKLFVSLLAIFFLFYRLVREKHNSYKFDNSKKIINYRTSKFIFLILLTILSVGCFFDFALFYKPAYIHYADIFHYYIGSKYSKELGYFNIYNATIIADAENNNYLKDSVLVMNLENYYLTPKESILKNAAYYKSKFSPSRWEEFKSDIKFFIERLTPGRFAEKVLLDHGYNASPVWNTTGSIISNIISVQNIILLTFLDLLLLITMFITIFYVLGIETMLIALIFFSINFLSVSVWNNGSFLRYDWLACSVMALCMIHKNRYKTAGILLSYAAMVRIFPVLFLSGIAIRIGFSTIKKKQIPKKYLHLFGTFILASIPLFVYGYSRGNGVDSWRNFAKKMTLHSEIMSCVDVGFRTVFLHDKSVSDFKKFLSTYGGKIVDPYDLWSHVKQIQFSQKKGEFLVFSIVSLFLFFLLIKDKDDVEAFAWSILLIFMSLQPTCYYYAFLIMFIIIFYRREINLTNTLYLSLLFAIQAFGYIIDIFDDFILRIYYRLSLAMLIYFIYLTISELYRKLRYQKRFV